MVVQIWIDVLVNTLLVTFGALGLLAVCSPRWFRRLSAWSSRWIDSDRFLDVLNMQIDIDSYVIPHSRILGTLVLMSVCVLWFVYLQYPA